jgi:hypothetical protein
MKIQAAMSQILLAAGAVIALYVVGWGYLYSYLGMFAIKITEINFSPVTVFIFSYPSLRLLWEFYWPEIGLVVFSLILLWLFGARFCRLIGVMRARVGAGDESPSVFSPIAPSLGLLIILALVLPLPLKALASWSAATDAARVWEGQTPELVPVFETPPLVTSRFDAVRLLTLRVWQKATDKQPERASRVSAAYEDCADRHAVRLIFATGERFYLFCRSRDVDTTGTVFEVKGREGLISGRFINR